MILLIFFFYIKCHHSLKKVQNLLYSFLVLFAPYRLLLKSDFAKYSKDSSSSLTGTDLSQHVQNYPIIEHYLLIPSPMSHYQVLRKLVFDLLNIKSHQDQCVQVLNDFVKDMPKYPPEIIHPFSMQVINKLKTIAPKVFLTINLINPDLVPKGCDDEPKDEIYTSIRAILNEHDQKEIDNRILKINRILSHEKVLANESLIGKMFEKLIQNNNCSQIVLSLLYNLIPIIPNTLLFMQIPETQTEDLILLIPLSLISPLEINITILSNIQLLKFSFLVVQRMQEKMNTESVIPLHRLTLSGSSAIESVIFTLRKFPKTITLFRKKAEFEAKVAFGAVLNCLLTCVEIPELKYFVKENNVRIVKYFNFLCNNVRSLSISRSFTFVLTLFNLQGVSPIVHVYSCWFEKPKIYLILHCLRTISPIDPSLPALVNEMSPHIIQFPFLVCQIAQKIIFSHSVANSIALQHLASTIEEKKGIDDFIIFANSIFSHELFFYAVHVISLFDQNPDFTNKEVSKSVERIILISILTESFYSARHLDRFARWLPFLNEKSLCNILTTCKKEKPENYRVNCRFILMLTYMPDFARNMLSKTTFFSLFAKYINQLFILPLNEHSYDSNKLESENDPRFISKNACLCISWHNLYISISEIYKMNQEKDASETHRLNLDKNITDMFSIGAKTLVKLWKNPNLHYLIANAFCDAILLDETRKIIINIIGKAQTEKDDAHFFEFLMSIDEKNTKEKFPEFNKVVLNAKIEKPPATKWGFSYWYDYAFGQEMSVKI